MAPLFVSVSHTMCYLALKLISHTVISSWFQAKPIRRWLEEKFGLTLLTRSYNPMNSSIFGDSLTYWVKVELRKRLYS